MIRVGCCGFSVAREKYYRRFSLVEVQQTFYQPPEQKTLHRWRDTAPAGFEFSVKAWQIITHSSSSPTYRRLKKGVGRAESYGFFRPSREVAVAWERTREAAQILRASVIVFQCPASFAPIRDNLKNMEQFFRGLNRGDFILAWEPRGKWPRELIGRLCRELDLVHVVDPFVSLPAYGSVRYYRLHGIGGYRHRYTDQELAALKNLAEGAEASYFLFNNLHMFEDACRFSAWLGRPP